MTLYCNAVEIRLPWPMLIAFGAALVTGQTVILWGLLALLPHEVGHYAAARYMGYAVERLTVHPYGASMSLDQPLVGMAELAVAAAGPMASVAAATLAAGAIGLVPGLRVIAPFVGASLLLAAVNCLPALPLDGGRMLRAGLIRCGSPVAARNVSAGLGVCVGGTLLLLMAYGLTQGLFNASLCWMGAFVLVGGLREWRNTGYAAATGVLRRQSSIRRRGSLRMQTIAVHETTTAREALKRLRGASLVAVVDDDMRLTGTVAEGDLFRGMAERGSEVSIRDLVH